jgi:pimeloyl-ACP methyl ester carboxylesterase
MVARLWRTILAVQLLSAVGIAVWLATVHDVHPVPATLIGILAPVSVHAAILTADFVLAFVYRGPHPVGVSGAWSWLRAWAIEIVDSVRTFSIAQPLFALRKYPEPEQPTGIPVLMVHGFVCNHAVWLPLAERLAGAGHVLAGIDLEPPVCEIDQHASAIADAIDRLRSATGQPRVALLCHSMGGLAARAYLRRFGHDAIAQVLTLGTPHRGTVHAYFGLAPCVRQMRPDSEWLRKLAASESAELRAKFTIFRTWQDNIVAPHAIQTLDGVRRVHDFHGIGHLTLAYDNRVQDLVIATLAADARRS